MNPVHAQAIQILKKTTRKLWDGKRPQSIDGRTRYVCNAIPLVRYEVPHSVEAHQFLKVYIKKQLEGCQTAEEWLRYHGVTNCSNDPVRLQKWRREWIKRMIAELETE